MGAVAPVTVFDIQAVLPASVVFSMVIAPVIPAKIVLTSRTSHEVNADGCLVRAVNLPPPFVDLDMIGVVLSG